MFKKIFIYTIILILIVMGLLQFPSLFIDEKMEYKSFKLYSNKNIELDQTVTTILDSVQNNLVNSDFYNEEQKMKLFFVRGSLYEKLIRLFGRKNLAFSHFNKHIYSADPYFEKSILKRSDHEYDWLNLVQIISHEGVHSQMYKDYSTLGFMTTPSWINEGYCEYIAYQPIRNRANYSLGDLMRVYDDTKGAWVKTEYQAMTPKLYLRDRILMEYLIDVKKKSIKEIIEDPELEPTKLLEEVRNYFELFDPKID